MTALLIVILLVYGLLFGSFINAWAWRLAHEESIAKGRSHCTSCGAPIRAYDNVPVVSWLLLRGRCRDCDEPISWRYPVGEAVTAALFVAVAAYGRPVLDPRPASLFVSVMVLVSEVDLDIQIIPDVIILPAAAVGLPLMIVLGDAPWWQYPLAGLGAAGFLWLVSEIYYRVRHVEGMGFGDVKMALCMGFYLGGAVVPGAVHRVHRGRRGGVARPRHPEERQADAHPLRPVPRRGRHPGAVRRADHHRLVPEHRHAGPVSAAS